MLTQALGLFLGIPFLFFTGWAASVPAVVLGMIGFGYCKGIYDANIFASLYDVVAVQTARSRRRNVELPGLAWRRFRSHCHRAGRQQIRDGPEHQRNGAGLLHLRTSDAAGSAANNCLPPKTPYRLKSM